MIRRPPRSTQSRSSAASDVYKRQVWICAVHDERSLLPQGLMRPDLVVERQVVRDLLGELRRVGDLALAKLLESAVGAHDYAGRSSSQSLPPDCRQDASLRPITPEH